MDLEQYIYFNESVISPIVRKTSPVTVEVEVHLRTNVSCQAIYM